MGTHWAVHGKAGGWGGHRMSATVREGPADCVGIDGVAAALKNMKRHGTPGLSGLVAGVMR